MQSILTIDDDRDICKLLDKFFKKKGFETTSRYNGFEAIEYLKNNPVDLVLCDFKLPDYNGIDILQKIKIIKPETQVIIITGYSDVKVAVDALKKGAYDYVTKPLYPDEILMTAQEALKQDLSPKSPGSKEVKVVPGKKYVVGISHQSQTIQKHIELIAPTNLSVIIQGETGTGKEYVARAIHEKSKRNQGPFEAIDCGALPKDLAGSELFGHVKGAFTGALADKKGSFQQANGGTLFLDEISNLSYENQIKLLRVLQERSVRKLGDTKDTPVDVRIIVASNEDLKDAVDNGDFREDIFYRLNEFKIDLTPLRERPEDIELFVNHFLQQANAQLDKAIEGFDPDALEALKAHQWHGNLRELNNLIKRSVLLCDKHVIDKSFIPSELLNASTNNSGITHLKLTDNAFTSLKDISEEAEKNMILRVLERTNNNKSKTAELLEVDRKTLYNKMKAYGIIN